MTSVRCQMHPPPPFHRPISNPDCDCLTGLGGGIGEGGVGSFDHRDQSSHLH